VSKNRLQFDVDVVARVFLENFGKHIPNCMVLDVAALTLIVDRFEGVQWLLLHGVLLHEIEGVIAWTEVTSHGLLM
jgi:hypothetical protein